MIRYIIFLLILIIVSCETPTNTGSLQVQTEVDTTIARIGDIINYNITSRNLGERLIVFPDIPETESMEIRDKMIAIQPSDINQASYQIVFWDTGSFVIPEFPIEILKTDSTKDITMLTDSVNVKIISMLTGAEDKNLRPIKDPIALKRAINWQLWLRAVVLLILIIVLVNLWHRRIRRKPLEKIEVSEFQSATDIALMRMNDLNDMVNRSNKEFYLHASFIMREFIENQYYIRALEMTTKEISKFESELVLSKDIFIDLIKLLERADLAKFAKYEFSKTLRKSDYNWILNFISKYK